MTFLLTRYKAIYSTLSPIFLCSIYIISSNVINIFFNSITHDIYLLICVVNKEKQQIIVREAVGTSFTLRYSHSFTIVNIVCCKYIVWHWNDMFLVLLCKRVVLLYEAGYKDYFLIYVKELNTWRIYLITVYCIPYQNLSSIYFVLLYQILIYYCR